MSRIFVAGSINMDVVARAVRHPSAGETVLGKALHFFPGGKGAIKPSQPPNSERVYR